MKKVLFSTILCLSLCLFVGNAMAQSTETATANYTSGSGTWTAPEGTWKVTQLEAWGGGGGGGNSTNKTGCGGGGGGAYAKYTTAISITPGSTLTYSVGAGGSGGSAGGNSYVTSSNANNAYVNAGGGKSPSNNTNAGANGGTVIKGTGYSGGKGGTGKQGGTISFSAGSGGGGGGAGTSGAGNPGKDAPNNSSGGNGGDAKSDGGGKGGDGVGYSSNGEGGSEYGGGGSGAGGRSLASYTGGSGAGGQIIITYEILTLTVNFDINYDGGGNPGSQTVLYYNQYGTLPAPTRDHYIFLGWYTAKNGVDKVTSTTKCTSTSNVTLHAHWAYAGAIADGSTNITPCGDYTIYNNTTPDAVEGLTYSWSYSYNGGTPVEVNINEKEPTGSQLGVSLNQPGDYVFTRYVHALSQTAASDNTFTVHVAYSAGSITQESVDQVSGEPVEVTGTAVDSSLYRWKCNGTVISGATGQNLTLAANTVCAPGTYVYTREAKKNGCDMEWVASANSYTVNITEVNPGGIAADTKYLCAAGNFSIGNKTEASTTPASTIVYEWRYSKDGGVETAVANSDKNTLTQADVTLSEGVYVFKRYAKVGCADWVAATGSDTLNVVTLPASYAAPASNFANLCVGGEWVITGDDYTLAGVASPHNIATKFNWMISKDGGAAASVGGSANLEQVLDATGNYTVYAAVEYFNQLACVVNTAPVTVTVGADPTIAVPTLTSDSVCPSGEVTMTAASIVGGVGDGYTYNWEFKADGPSTWDTVSASEATYDQYKGTSITASNFIELGDVQYRSYVSNAQGCDAHSPAADLNIIEVAVPVVRGDTTVCPEAGKFITFKASTTDPSFTLRWFENATTATYTETTPQVAMDNELDTTNYVAQYNPGNGCVSARVPDAIYITYSAHLQYVDASGDLDQTVCQNDGIEDIQFTHGGDCEPQITFDPAMPAGVTIDNSVAGITTITGAPTEEGTITYHVELLPDGMTKCAAPNSYDGSIKVNPVYNVTENKTICSGSYTISDQKGHSYTFTESGTYTKTLETVTGCDSVVTLNLYVHEWNQFGFEDNEEALATWTNFSSVSGNMSADGGVNRSASKITYSGWSGSNTTRGNLASTSSLVSAAGNSLGLLNGTSSSNLNNGKSITITTSTKDYGNLKLHFDCGAERFKALTGDYSTYDHAFAYIAYSYTTSSGSGTIASGTETEVLDHQTELYEKSVDIDLSSLSNLFDNQDEITITLTFSGAGYSIVPFVTHTQYLRIDNVCISGTKIKELELDGNTQACTNESLIVVATPPYTNTHVEPPVTTPVVYKWERIVGGVSTELGETSNVLVDNEVQAGDYKYVVSVGEAPCGQSDTLDVYGIVPSYRLDIIRHGYVCSNEVDQVSNITFTDDCQYVDGMLIVTPTADEMRTPGIYTCQLSIPTTANPCDSIITLELEVLKAFDTTVIANICLGETYDQYGFNITPTEEGVTYYTSDPSWTCASGCDSIYRLTLITNSVQQALTSEYDVTLAAWPMDQGKSNFIPACGVRTSNSSFKVYDGGNELSFEDNVTGNVPASDYCYTESSSNSALRWRNLRSESVIAGTPDYDYYDGVYFEIKLNPHDYDSLKLKFDYLRENSEKNGQAFNVVNYYYKFSETGSYSSLLGSKNLSDESSWSSQTIDFSSIATLDEDVIYLKLEFMGGSIGDIYTYSGGGWTTLRTYLPSYITIDNVMVLGDRPARATLDGTAQTCNKAGDFVCEGEAVTFTCQGDDTYFKFYVVDETTNDETSFNGATSINITPIQSTSYIIKAVEQTTMCDSVWGPFNVEVVKNPTLTLTTGTLDEALCGHETLDVEFLIENATSDSLIWLTEGGVKPDGISVSDDNNGNIALGGTLTNGGSARYQVIANPDTRCSAAILSKNGTISTLLQPTIIQTIGKDSVCQGADMQFVVDTTGLKFGLVPEDQRFKWYTADMTLGTQDTLTYVADEATHYTRHYIQVKQAGGCTTLDSMDIVVYDLAGDTLRTEDKTYTFNYGDNFLSADSLVVPDLMHKAEPVPANFIATVEHTGGNKLYPPSMDDMNLTITWTITDVCGNMHVKNQKIHFILPPCGGDMTVTDKNGNVYHTVRMGLNCWMKENLKATLYDDDTTIPVAMGYTGGNYTDSAANANTYGRLYTWYSAVKIPENSDASVLPQTNAQGHVQGVCPEGWCLPDRECFASLHDIDMNRMRLAGDEYWLDGGGNNTTQFSLVGAGFYNNIMNRFENLRFITYFWTSEEFDNTTVKSFMADCHCYSWQEIYHEKGSAFSVRCVKEKE